MVLISILGDFDSNILPIFFQYAQEIDTHILITDKRTEDIDHADQVQRGLKRFCLEYDFDVALLQMQFDEDQLESINKIFERIDKLTHNKQLLFNMSDGMASTLALMQDKIFERDGSVLAYDRFDNSCNIVSKEGMKKEIIAGMTIREHLLLKDIDYEEPDYEAIHARADVVKKLMQMSDSFIPFRKESKLQEYVGEYAEIETLLRQIDKREDQFFIDGAIFEEYIYNLVSDVGFDDVALSTKVRYYPVDDTRGFNNELDILAIKDNHLHIIECKFSTFLSKVEEFVYKYDSIINLLDSDGKTMLLIVGGDDFRYKSGKKQHLIPGGAKRRSQHTGINIYHAKKLDENAFLQEVKSFFQLR